MACGGEKKEPRNGRLKIRPEGANPPGINDHFKGAFSLSFLPLHLRISFFSLLCSDVQHRREAAAGRAGGVQAGVRHVRQKLRWNDIDQGENGGLSSCADMSLWNRRHFYVDCKAIKLATPVCMDRDDGSGPGRMKYI